MDLNENITFQTVLDLVVDIADAKSAADAWLSVERICRDLGYTYAGFGAVTPGPEGNHVRLDYATSSFRKIFTEYEQAELDLLSPSVNAMSNGRRLIFTHDECRKASGRWKAGAERLLEYMRQNDVGGHCAVRISRPDASSFCFLGVGVIGACNEKLFVSRSSRLESLLVLVGRSFAVAAMRGNNEAIVNMLSNREKHILTMFAHGYSMREIAAAENRSITTVRHQIDSARKRLGARNSTHAATVAIALGLIEFLP